MVARKFSWFIMGFVEGFAFFFKFWASVFTSYIGWLPWLQPKRKSIIGEIVLVTGAGHGMGRLEAIEFSKRGATIVVVDINEENNDETADLIRETGGKAHAYRCDVSKKENIKALAAKIKEEVGDISILVNNAGVVYVADILSLTDEKIQRTFDVNVLAHFWLIREFLPAMKRKNHGHIVALASQAGISGIPYMTDYCSTKFAVIGLCDSLRRELRWQKYDGIHVTYICPTFVSTGFLKNPSTRLMKIFTPEEVVTELMEGVLTNKFCVAVPEDRRKNLMFRAIMPVKTQELMFDFVNPTCDRVDMKKEY